jgi:peptide-methionine (S)-S-oxide reductase
MGQQREIGEASKQEADAALAQDVVTPVLDASAFYPAEDYRQNHYEKNPLKYNFYRWNCGRDQRLEELWGDAACGPKGL